MKRVDTGNNTTSTSGNDLKILCYLHVRFQTGRSTHPAKNQCVDGTLSEETGEISFSQAGQIKVNISPDELERKLVENFSE